MKCASCDQPCSQAGHLKGKEIKRDKASITYACTRCGIYLRQALCECCGVAIGALETDPGDNAKAAAKREAKGRS